MSVLPTTFLSRPNTAAFVSGRAAFAALLDNMPRPQRVWVPLFTCDALLEPLLRRSIPVSRYRTDERLMPILPADAEPEELIVLTDWFGCTHRQVLASLPQCRCRVVLDATGALYREVPAGIPCFCSPRKFCGMADGGLAVAPFPLLHLPPVDRIARTERLCNSGNTYTAVQTEENALRRLELRLHPNSLRRLLAFPWTEDNDARCRRYAYLHSRLRDINRLPIPDTMTAGPLCYPLLTGIPGLRDELIDAGIRLPLYWEEVIRNTDAGDAENYIARNLLPLPIGSGSAPERMVALITGRS